MNKNRISMITERWSFNTKFIGVLWSKIYHGAKLRFYSTLATKQLKLKLNPNWITGFTDAEGSFIISILKNPKSKVGWVIQTRFQIGLHQKDLTILEKIKSYFGVGKISNQGKDSIQYRVYLLQDLINIIIPHFDKYPLLTQKRADFELFKMVVEIMNRKEHLTIEGLKKIVLIKSSINKGLSNELKKAFPNIISTTRPLVGDQPIKDPNWITGFTSGEGCFMILITKSASTTIGERVQLRFIIAQHSRDDKLIKSLVTYFGCGNIINSQKAIYFIVAKFSDVNEKIIPFFEKYKIEGVKSRDFEDFKRVSILMKNKEHLTKEGLNKILEIKMGMNKGRQ